MASEWKSQKGRTSDRSMMHNSNRRLKRKNDSFLSISMYGTYIMLRYMADFMAYASIVKTLPGPPVKGREKFYCICINAISSCNSASSIFSSFTK